MPSLRELYERTNKYHSYNPALYDVLEALVEAVEPEEHTCGECGFFREKLCPVWYAVQDGLACKLFGPRSPDTVAEPGPHTCGKCSSFRKFHGCPSAPRDSDRWYFVWPDEPACERFVAQVEPEDTPTDEEYNDARDNRIRFLQKELAEAKAEVGSLRTLWLSERNEERNCSGKLHNAQKKLASYTASVNADAEIGRLVRGMRPWSRLTRGFGQQYWVAMADEQMPWERVSGMSEDPAEALRAIQEVGDA